MPDKTLTAMTTSTAGVRKQLHDSCRAMTQYALASGLKLPAEVIERLQMVSPDEDGNEAENAVDIHRLTLIHNRLADLVAPASPKTILLLAKEEARGGRVVLFGAVPLVRRLIAVAIVSLIGFVLVSLSPEVNGQGFDLMKNSGQVLLLNELFLLFSASMGASFANLITAQSYIKNNTFDPKFESSYWVRYVLGLMAGTILALLIPVEKLAAEATGDGATLIEQMGKPAMALIGGYASSAVYQILDRLVSAMESLVKGDDGAAAMAEAAAAKAKADHTDTQNKVRLAANLESLEQKIAHANPDELRGHLAKMRRQLLLGEEADEEF